MGTLRLQFERRDDVTILARSEHSPPLQVVRAFPSEGGGALVHLHNLSGGVLGGDRLEASIEVGARAEVQVTSTGATRVYRHRGAAPATAVTQAAVGEDGLLEYVPDPIIPYACARYVQRTAIDLAPGAGLFWWEICAPGREARGEVFAYELLELHFEISSSGTAVALERARIEPRLRAPSSPARLGAFRYWATFYICRAGVDSLRWCELEIELAELAGRLSQEGQVLWAASRLARAGVVVRVLAQNGLEIPRGLAAFWRAAKLKLYGREPVLPRKVN